MTETKAAKPEATYNDFAKLDIRIGRIVEVRPFERARAPSYKVAVDLGDLGICWSSAQITSYAPGDLEGRSSPACAIFHLGTSPASSQKSSSSTRGTWPAT